MEQPVPNVTVEDVKKIALRDFGEAQLSEVLSVLEQYGKQEWNSPGSARIQLAILKLAAGDMAVLSDQLKRASVDFRDVISWAEYPRYSKEVGFDDVKPAIKREVITDDWEEYCKWPGRIAGPAGGACQEDRGGLATLEDNYDPEAHPYR